MSTEAMQVKDASGRYLAKAEVHDVPPGYKRTEVGIIPINWEVATLTQVSGKITVGFVGSMAHLFESRGVPLLRGQNILPGRLDLADTLFISTETHRRWHKSALHSGDVVLVRVGYPGTACVIPEGLGEANAASLVVVRPIKAKLSPRFLSFILNSDSGKQQIESYLVGGAQQVLNVTIAATFRFPLPSLAEQRAIAEALSDVDGLLGALEALIAKKRAIKQAAMQQLLTGKTRLPGFSGAWETAVLPQATVVRKGQLITASSLIPGSVPVIAGGKTPAYFHAEANRFQPCVTVSASGASAGYVALHKEPIFASDCSTVEESKIVTIEFAYYWLLNIQEIVYGLQSGGAQPHVQPKDLARLHIAYPALAEQQAIATVLSDMDAEIAALERRRDKTRALKQGMLQQLLTGRIRLI